MIADGFTLLEGSVSWVLSGVLGLMLICFFVLSRGRRKAEEKRTTATKNGTKSLKVLFGSQTGTAKRFAEQLHREFRSRGWSSSVIDIKDYDPEDCLPQDADSGQLCIFVLATYTNGQPTDSAVWFCQWLEEAVKDFRVQKLMLKGMLYAVLGLGNSLYEDNFNKAGKNVDNWLSALSAKRVAALGLADENVAVSQNGGIEGDFVVWKNKLIQLIEPWISGGVDTLSHVDNHVTSHEEEEEEDLVESSSDSGNEGDKGDGLVDLEDLSKPMLQSTSLKKSTPNGTVAQHEMVTPVIRQSLTKQGYKIIGSHSGVKLCRWTKSMLRGRGGCYKHTFYGIESHRCMETTPSLACANKCVFCWRHHTNPVGTEWKWNMDEPQAILDGALSYHYQMIKEFRGVPGVQKEKLEEARTAQHCALSLVGEPIMYPKINELVRLLHEKKISTFLVTNAQFPDAIRNLIPVTQLYVSVDASNKESLKRIDRPLFRDYWARFVDSLKALSGKGQRTVYRLTLVKAWNTEELEGYAQLVSLGNPDFIEIKGVTYCGESKASTLTMKNVPWHEEVVAFVRTLVDLLPNYELACEHEHSNCILVANKKFLIDGAWHTWIDYPKFHELMREYESSGGEKPFSASDYMSRTPDWALFDNPHHGFDPKETRWQRKRKGKDISGC
eukprot:m.240698 g.240698  ORF g.240698 m.240698 type:complete len:668 (+) comp40196_c1_seq26:72-2075(+)